MDPVRVPLTLIQELARENRAPWDQNLSTLDTHADIARDEAMRWLQHDRVRVATQLLNDVGGRREPWETHPLGLAGCSKAVWELLRTPMSKAL